MITITPIPALDSNYFWVIRPDQTSPSVYLVDPGDAAPVIAFLRQNQLTLSAILVTHRHRDHTQGIAALREHWPVPVYGPASEQIPQVTHVVGDNDKLRFEGISLKVIAVPGHTWEHIAYFCAGSQTHPPLLFCGDALFAGGCGRRFDGTAEVMWKSLQTLANLPEDTQIYCAHEYTQANLEFACAVEPDNSELCTRLEQVKRIRAQGAITLPTSLALEKATNPFLRCEQTSIKTFAERKTQQHFATPADVFGALRLIKDTWPDSGKPPKTIKPDQLSSPL